MTDPGGEYLNSSVIPLHHDEEHLLAPGLIAAITIGSMFIFYFMIMMVVCLGEWYQYTHGKKGQSNFASNSSTRSSNSTSQARRQRNFSNTDASASQSDPRSSSSAYRSEESATNKRQYRISRNDITIHENEEVHIEPCVISNQSAAEVLETDKMTDLIANDSNDRLSVEIEVSTIPLLSRYSSISQGRDDDMFSESAESGDLSRLEADV